MNLHSSTTITKHPRCIAAGWLTIAALVFAAAPVFAHGGFDHVMGTVVQVSNHTLTVKTAKGNVDVKLDDKTELTKNDQKRRSLLI